MRIKDISSPKRFTLIAGPCQLESSEHSVMIASAIKEIASAREIPYIFKGSFDKANRTSVDSARGPGLERGSEILKHVKNTVGVPTLTDIHETNHPEKLGDAADILQIPAFLCRQTDLLVSAGNSGKIVNIKKGQFLHPRDMKYAAEKVTSTGNTEVLLCERGTSFGYRDLVVDMRSLQDMRELGFPVVFDGTHSVQSIGGSGGSSGGSREYIPALCRSAIAVGIDFLFLEVHENPPLAPSDGKNMIPLADLDSLLAELVAIDEAIRR